MGHCCSHLPSNPSETDKLDETSSLANNASKNPATISILLLGLGEAGKTTIFKQATLIHGSGFSEAERKAFKSVIHQNIAATMLTLVTACDQQHLNLPLPQNLVADADIVRQSAKNDNVKLPEDIAIEVLERLWKAKQIQQAFTKCNLFAHGDSAEYFFEHLGRVSRFDYLPTNDDIIRARVASATLERLEFDWHSHHIELVDVAHANNRQKWMTHLNSVNTMLFVAALSDFDLVTDDGHGNCLAEAVRLFSDLCHSRFLRDARVTLVLNKLDMFKTKLLNSNITDAFPDYTGPQEVEPALAFISNAFIAQSDHYVTVHTCTAIDLDHVKQILESELQDITGMSATTTMASGNLNGGGGGGNGVGANASENGGGNSRSGRGGRRVFRRRTQNRSSVQALNDEEHENEL